MTHPDIPRRRLRHHHLTGTLLGKPEDVVRWLGAVQAQDYHGAKWALARRAQGASSASIDEVFNQGKVLRTHVLRPTWHFVLPEDIRWLLRLTAPRVKARMAYSDRRLELDDVLLGRSNELIAKALEGGNHLTRQELGRALGNHGIVASGQRLAHVVMRAELDAVICSGPLRGKQFTYALLDERAPQATGLDRDDALAELAKRYFTSHGPATVQDFAWWSGLTVAEAKRGIELAGPQLSQETMQTKTYWTGSTESTGDDESTTVHLLPNYDEYLISYEDYSPIFSGEVHQLAKPFGNALLAHIVVRNGLVVGGWKRAIRKNEVVIKVDLLVKLTEAEQAALQREAQRYSQFMGLPLTC